MSTEKPRVLVTGVTGYIGGRLAPRLLDAGYPIRCLVRSPRKAMQRTWSNDPRVEFVQDDMSDLDRLSEHLSGCGPAYYLVHSMEAAGGAYARRDRELAQHFATAAARAGISRIVYLGGLGELGDDLSEHLSSRREVERALASGPVPVTVFRAAMIIGSGSASFELLRYLVERLPVMVTPRWVATECQPIAVQNVLHDLVACLDVPETSGATLDVGGPEVLPYRELIQLMAKAMGLRRRLIVSVPVLTPRLSSLWIHLVTPLSARIARPLTEGLRNRVVCRDGKAQALLPQRLLSVREAIDAALGKAADHEIETAWSDAGTIPGDPDWAGGTVFEDRRSRIVAAPAATVFQAICRLGGTHGYHGTDWLWRVRGFLDRLVGGPGLRRGRRDPRRLRYGDALDFWRVTDIEPPRRLVLRAEMRLPGEALLEFSIESEVPASEGSSLVQTARFRPHGLLGLLYWYTVLPLHGLVFNAMLRGIAAEAEIEAARPHPPANG